MHKNIHAIQETEKKCGEVHIHATDMKEEASLWKDVAFLRKKDKCSLVTDLFLFLSATVLR